MPLRLVFFIQKNLGSMLKCILNITIHGLGSESGSSSGLFMSEFLNCEIVIKMVCVESSESMRGELVVNLGQGEEVGVGWV